MITIIKENRMKVSEKALNFSTSNHNNRNTTKTQAHKAAFRKTTANDNNQAGERLALTNTKPTENKMKNYLDKLITEETKNFN